MNNKGFTLVELLAVIVIIVAILMIAMPSLTSSLERSKKKQNQAKYELLKSAAEIYVSDNRNAIADVDTCRIDFSELHDANLVTENDLLDADGNNLGGVIIYNKTTKDFSYEMSSTGISLNRCID